MNVTLNTLEKSRLAEFRRGGEWHLERKGDELADWIAFGLDLVLHAGRWARRQRFGEQNVEMKGDGTPVTPVESEIEQLLRSRLADFEPSARVVGEESGGELPARGVAVAVDPVDGTWAFMSRTETFSTTLAMFRDGRPFLGMVASPSTGEVGYGTLDTGTRLIQLSMLGEDDSGRDLPFAGSDPNVVLVNVHPGRGTRTLVEALYGAWESSDVRMVRSPGGSPSWALLEAAKGRFVYINRWSQRQAAPYDLAAGVLLVRGAGGEVTDLQGHAIDPVRHAGPFVAAIDEAARNTVLEIAQEVLT
jgi:fructose-1,6-bisphosphatase/inositol monophosphatase family enzyme